MGCVDDRMGVRGFPVGYVKKRVIRNSLMSVGYGMEHAVTDELTTMSDIVIVTTGQFVTESFTAQDVSDINRITGVTDIGSMNVGITEVKYLGEVIPIPLAGFDPHGMENVIRNRINLMEGRLLEDRGQRGCVIGFNVAKKYFEDDIELNDKIIIGERISGLLVSMKNRDRVSSPILTTRSTRR